MGRLTKVCASIIIFFMTAACCSALAETGAKICSVNIPMALEGWKEYGDGRVEFDNWMKLKDEEMKKREEEMKPLVEALQDPSLSKEDREKKLAEWREKAADNQNFMKALNEEKIKKERSITGPLQQKLQGIVREICEEKGFDVALDSRKTVMIYRGAGVKIPDITDEVMEKLK